MFHISGILDFSGVSGKNELLIRNYLDSIYPEGHYDKKTFHPNENIDIWGVWRTKDRCRYYEDSELFIVYTGFIFPVESQKSQCHEGSRPVIQFISELFKKYDSGLTLKIKGSYILLVYSKTKNRLLICNDHFGFLKLYYHVTNQRFIFSTSLALFVRCGFKERKVYISTLLQKLVFNYPISDKTYIDGVNLLPAATILTSANAKTEIKKYWSSSSLMNNPCYNYSNGVEIVHHALETVLNSYTMAHRKFGLSLTGGWDGRLILSYFVKNKTKDFFLYSFGTEKSWDITIPEMISKREGFDYVPIYLNSEYIKTHQADFSRECILSSDGVRNLNLGHYIYAMSVIGMRTSDILSGNCGSNILKPLNTLGPIYNENIKKLFEYENLSEALQQIKNSFCSNNPFFKIRNQDWDSLFHDLVSKSSLNTTGLSKNQRFYCFLLDTIEGMYFGSETVSYLKYVNNYSPFIDYDFLKELASTPYFGAHHDFFSKSGIIPRYHLSSLYSKLIIMNAPNLANYVTDRGYSLKDMKSIPGQGKILMNRIKNKLSTKIRGHALEFNYPEVFESMKDLTHDIDLPLLDDKNIEINALLKHRTVQNYKSFIIWFNSL